MPATPSERPRLTLADLRTGTRSRQTGAWLQTDLHAGYALPNGARALRPPHCTSLIKIEMPRSFIARPSAEKPTSRNTLLLTTLVATFATLASGVSPAQNLYRSVGPDGRVTYSDRAISPNAKPSTEAVSSADGSASSANAQLPYELRQTANRYPVTIYTGKDCEPCDEARSHLQNRGIPFSERSIDTSSDVAALKKLSGQDSLPFATIGNQHLKGFGADSWDQYLSAAGYPKQPQLPKNYKAPAAKPLTVPGPAVTEAAKPAERPAARITTPAVPAPGAPTPDNPAGLRF